MNEALLKRINGIYEEAVVKVFEAVAGSAAAAAGATQTVAGTQGTAGGVAVGAGQSSQNTQTGASHKNDVSAPEVIESLNTATLADIAHMSKVNARTFDIASTALSLAALTASTNAGAQQGNATTQQNEEYSTRKKAGTLDFVVLGDAAEEAADDTDR